VVPFDIYSPADQRKLHRKNLYSQQYKMLHVLMLSGIFHWLVSAAKQYNVRRKFIISESQSSKEHGRRSFHCTLAEREQQLTTTTSNLPKNSTSKLDKSPEDKTNKREG